MTDDDKNGCFGAVMLCLGVMGGAMLGSGISGSVWRRECIERGVAEYDKTTAAWKWTVEVKPEHERSEK